MCSDACVLSCVVRRASCASSGKRVYARVVAYARSRKTIAVTPHARAHQIGIGYALARHQHRALMSRLASFSRKFCANSCALGALDEDYVRVPCHNFIYLYQVKCRSLRHLSGNWNCVYKRSMRFPFPFSDILLPFKPIGASSHLAAEHIPELCRASCARIVSSMHHIRCMTRRQLHTPSTTSTTTTTTNDDLHCLLAWHGKQVGYNTKSRHPRRCRRTDTDNDRCNTPA